MSETPSGEMNAKQKIILTDSMIKSHRQLRLNPHDPEVWDKAVKELNANGPVHTVEEWMDIWTNIKSFVENQVEEQNGNTSNFQSYFSAVYKFIQLSKQLETEKSSTSLTETKKDGKSSHSCDPAKEPPPMAIKLWKIINCAKPAFPNKVNSPKANALIGSLEKMFSDLSIKLVESFSELENVWEATLAVDQENAEYQISFLIRILNRSKSIVTVLENLPKKIAEAIAAKLCK